MPIPSSIRNEFPILAIKGLVYLDTAASSQKPEKVISGIPRFLRNDYSNVHRGAHFLGERATQHYEQSRKKVADFLGADSSREIIFTKNATEAVNLVARSFGDAENFFSEGDRIVLTRAEHHANLVPWFQLAERKKLRIEYFELDAEQNLVLDNLDELLAPPTKMLGVTHVSNVIGTRFPVEMLCACAREKGVLTLIDACQSVPHFSVDVQKIGCDFLVLSAHKMYGPSGVGILYGKLDLLRDMPPFLGGGEMIREVRYDGFLPAEAPHKFEAGTPPIVGVFGTGIAIDFLQEIGMDAIKEHDRELSGYARELLEKIEGVRIISHRDAIGLTSFVFQGGNNYELADFLSDRGICVRVGHHCAEPLHKYLNISTSIRASYGVYNTRDEIGFFIKMVQEGIQKQGTRVIL
ncbi:cysteine desulfurase [Candidatus Peregrinibacteria bacterium]|nr:MAG: cysteine desulfurase [Candidatus Peregrinibacteria bacterium]